MNRARVLLVAVLACAAIGTSGTLHAQARGPAASKVRGNQKPIEKPPLVLDEAARARKIAEMEAWLGRLVGRFDGDAKTAAADRMEKVQSTAMCTHIGDGPGVRCIVGMGLPANLPALVTQAAPDPAAYTGRLPILHFGINPDSLELRLMVVDTSQVGGRSGMLAGDTVNFSDNWNVCHKVPFGYCWVAVEITAKPAGEIFMKLAADGWSNGRKIRNLKGTGHAHDIELHLYREP